MRADFTARVRQGHWPHPFPPPAPEPHQPEVHLLPPLVYVPPRFEYKHLERDAGAVLTETELNELGGAGWELTGVLTTGERAHFYLKREMR